MPLPSLSIDNAIIGLPISEAQAQFIIASATQAPYGRGEDTVVDTSVRRTWQISPSQFTINSSQWSKKLHVLLSKVKEELGCNASMEVECELYKLLLYEPGGFFKVSYAISGLAMQLQYHFTYSCMSLATTKVSLCIRLSYTFLKIWPFSFSEITIPIWEEWGKLCNSPKGGCSPSSKCIP